MSFPRRQFLHLAAGGRPHCQRSLALRVAQVYRRGRDASSVGFSGRGTVYSLHSSLGPWAVGTTLTAFVHEKPPGAGSNLAPSGARAAPDGFPAALIGVANTLLHAVLTSSISISSCDIVARLCERRTRPTCSWEVNPSVSGSHDPGVYHLCQRAIRASSTLQHPSVESAPRGR